MTYAKNTSVPVDRSRAEIERLLMKHGATQFSSGWDQKVAYVNFVSSGKHVIFILTLPDIASPKFTEEMRGGQRTYRKNSAEKARSLWEQACRSNWRSLVLVIKAKLEAVESGITTFEQEFLAHIVIPGTDKTIGDALIPRLADAYSGSVPLLPMLEAR